MKDRKGKVSFESPTPAHADADAVNAADMMLTYARMNARRAKSTGAAKAFLAWEELAAAVLQNGGVVPAPADCLEVAA